MRPNQAQDKSSLSFLKGTAALEREEYKLAEVGFAQALHEDPNNARAMIFLLYAQLKRRPTLRLIDGLQNSLKLAPQDTVVLRTAAKVYVILDQAGKGLALLEKARSIDPKDAETHAELAAGYLSLRKRPECEAALTAALKIDAADVLALSVKSAFAKVYFDAAPALKAEGQPLRKTRGTAESFLIEGNAALARNEWAAGYWSLRESLRLNPKSVEAQAALTAALRRRFPLYDAFYKFSIQAVYWHVVTSFVLVYAIVRLAVLAMNYSGDAMPVWQRPALVLSVILLTVLAAVLLAPMPIVNFALRFHPIGRYTLSRVAKAESQVSLLCLMSGFGSLLIGAPHPWGLAAGATYIVLFAVLATSMRAFRSWSGRMTVLIFVTLLWLVATTIWFVLPLLSVLVFRGIQFGSGV